jgi:tRNA A-37 threonylcarbamoyl transferase component Bud32
VRLIKIDFLTLKMVKFDKLTRLLMSTATTTATFLPHCPTMSHFLRAISPSLEEYEGDIASRGIRTFDQLAALPYENYLEFLYSCPQATKLFNAVQATKNGDHCPYGDNSGRILPVGYTPKALWDSEEDWMWDSGDDGEEDNGLILCQSCMYYKAPEKFQGRDTCIDCPKQLYHIMEQIGEGCSSKVYKATHRKHGNVAVKVIDKEYAEFAKTEASLMQQMQAYPANFLRVYDTWLDDEGRFCIAMEPIRYTLEEVLMGESDVLLTPEIRYFIVRELAKAISACHKERIAHFDIKANNIGLMEDGRLVLFDFGLAERFEMISDPLFQKDVAAGELVKVSKEHRPPEGFLHNYPLTEKADIWSFAVVVYDIFMVKNLFNVDTFQTTLATLPANLNKQVPSYIEDLIRRCTQLDPKDRPSTEEWCNV